MSNEPGAIVITIYNIIKSLKMLDSCFNAEIVYENYNRFLLDKNKKTVLDKIRLNHKKHHNNTPIGVFSSVANIKGWLKKHTFRLPVLWFDECEEKFLFKRDLLYRLKPYDYNL